MNKIQDAYKDLKPSETEKEAMLQNILSYNKEIKVMENKKKKFALPIALAAAIVLAVMVSPMLNKDEEITAPPESESTAAPQPPQPPASSPMPGMRKFLNYNGHRYEFINNGEKFDNLKLGESLGTLEFDIAANPGENSALDLASSFEVGAEIYSIEGTDSFFRIAVKGNDGVFMAQNVAAVGNDMDIKKLFESADFNANVEAIDIYDHFEREKLSQIAPEDIDKLLDELSLSREAELQNEDYEKIARSQTEGKSFRLIFKLKEGPDYKVYVIPEMNISMIGDNRLYLPDSFNETFYDYFKDLKQGPPVMN